MECSRRVDRQLFLSCQFVVAAAVYVECFCDLCLYFALNILSYNNILFGRFLTIMRIIARIVIDSNIHEKKENVDAKNEVAVVLTCTMGIIVFIHKYK